jgi:hypothetical protein
MAEQLSVDILLEKRDAQLPEELLSLLLDAPSFNNFSDEVSCFKSEELDYNKKMLHLMLYIFRLYFNFRSTMMSLRFDERLINFCRQVLAEFPTSIRGYLLSWLLVYDSYSNASFKVRNDYSEILKSESYINPLLTFIFDILGHSDGHPMNIASFDTSKIRSYDIWDAIDGSESNEKNMHWLLINIYYLCLKYTSSLAKNWWLDCKSVCL